MRIFPLLMLLVVAAGCASKKSGCTPELTEAYLNSAEIIMTGVVSEERGDPEGGPIVRPVKIFKGAASRDVVVDVSKTKFALVVGQEYLFYGNRNALNHLIIDSCSRTGLLKESAQDTAFLIEKIPCINPSADKDVTCIQIYEPVCGCDNKTYGNSCIARSQGINIYTMGECAE